MKSTKILAGLLGSTMFATVAFAAAGDASLATAAKQGDRTAVQSALKAMSKQQVANQGSSALVWAATRDDKEMVDLLLKAGANVKAANEFGATPIYAASELSDPSMVVKLLAAGADPNVALMSGETPLMAASGRGNVETVKALLKGGANPNAKEENAGQTALMWAISNQQVSTIDALVKGGADVNAGSKSGFTPLMFAAQKGDAQISRILLKAGARVNEPQPRSGLTALMVASAMVHPEAVNALLEAKADTNLVDSNGYGALHKVVRDSDYGIDPARKDDVVAIVKTLLKNGANPNLRIQQDKEKAADEIKRGANAFYGRRTALTVTEITLQGATPIVLAAEVNNLDAIKALVEAGADPNIATESGTTALMMASGAGTDVQRAREPEERAVVVQTARYLVEHGADVNKPGQFGWTALHAAAYQGLNDEIEFLVKSGAKIDQKDEFGQTPLSISMSVLTKEIGARRLQIPRRYREDTAKLLLKLGPTPLHESGVNVVLQRSGDENLGKDVPR
jgi:ankyrin repeat protein